VIVRAEFVGRKPWASWSIEYDEDNPPGTERDYLMPLDLPTPPMCQDHFWRTIPCGALATHHVIRLGTNRTWLMCEAHAQERKGGPYLVRSLSEMLAQPSPPVLEAGNDIQ